MASVYSGASWTGDYTYTRVRVDYSGTSATAHLLYTRTNTYSGATSSGSATFTFGGASVGFNQTRYGQMTDSELASVGFGISMGGGYYDGSSSGGYMGGSWGVTIPSQYTAPTGLGINSIVRGIEEFTANVYISGWGTNSTGSSSKYRELQVWTKGMSEPRRYQPSYGSSTSGNITANNSSSGSLTIVGNTEYTLGAYATNGNVATGSQNMGNYTTLAYAPTLAVDTLGEDNVVINYSTRADGGKYTKTIEYSLDDGATWTAGATVSTGSATTGQFTISGLTDDTEYTLKCRVSTNAGTTAGSDVVFRTLESHKLYGSVNGQTKKVTKLYGSVSGQTKEIKKLYASVGGVTKRIF